MPASGDACTPAAQITVRASIRSVPAGLCTTTDSSSTDVTRTPMRSSTPIAPSSREAISDSRSPKWLSGSWPASSSNTRTLVGSMRRKLVPSARWASSRICPAISTPVGPAPTIADGQPAGLLLGISLSSAISSACSSCAAQAQRVREGLHAGAWVASSSWPK